MMKLTLAEPRLLKESIMIISELVNEINMKVDKDKIEVVAMDPANVAMVIFKLLSSAFVEYQVSENVEFAVNLENLKQILRRAKPTDVVSLELINSKLRIQLKGESTRTFNISLIDIDEKEQKIPNLKFPLSIEVPTMIFDEAIEDMGIISESVVLTAEPERFIIESQSKLNNARVEVTTDSETSINLEGDKQIKSKYSVEYLKKMIKGSKLSDVVTLYFGEEYPLKVDYKVTDKLQLSFILAPRVAND